MKLLIIPNLYHDQKPLLDHQKPIWLSPTHYSFIERLVLYFRNISWYLRNNMSSTLQWSFVQLRIALYARNFNLDTGFRCIRKLLNWLLHGTWRQKKASTAVVIGKMENLKTSRRSQRLAKRPWPLLLISYPKLAAGNHRKPIAILNYCHWEYSDTWTCMHMGGLPVRFQISSPTKDDLTCVCNWSTLLLDAKNTCIRVGILQGIC